MSSDCCSDEQADEDEDSDSSFRNETHYTINDTLGSPCRNWRNEVNSHNPLISSKESNLYNVFITCIHHDPEYNGVCLQPMHKNSSSTHISVLPFELLLRIIRWTVGSHLNMRILGILACVCRGFYLLAYDNSIWRDICSKLWPVRFTHKNNIGHNNKTTYLSSMNYTTWREMAIYRPQVLYHGCYLGRVTYIRRGEPGIGSSYKPVFEVVYYRGIRFHVSSNQISMFTAPSDPSSIVAVLSKSHQLASLSTDVSLFENSNNDSQAVIKTAASGTLLEGTYEWYDHDSIICTLHQLTDKENQPPIRKHRRLGSIIPELTVTFTIKFKIRNKNGRLHNQLIWDSYVIHTFDKSSKNESTTVLELTKQHFPPCRFVRVRNFISDAATSLL
ncbi:F-box only protein isoform 3 [Schistosoma japonicum]|uniref:F-box only protein 9 n=2 Tax=Schistosoma japonicum TaxID=6182 RepID=C1L5H1_SCHJA|nr:F-box only protein 9 [Schistosoma japonicum]TNN15247.1 F-box only protein isoform 3 [Schistosoma japonicum]CAX69949.1 F-box only protein 9 [Schistosoma japonicum]